MFTVVLLRSVNVNEVQRYHMVMVTNPVTPISLVCRVTQNNMMVMMMMVNDVDIFYSRIQAVSQV